MLSLVLAHYAIRAIMNNKADDSETPGGVTAVDIDLTRMSATMAASTATDMLAQNPQNYLGKTVKVSGIFAPFLYEGETYYFVEIAATDECCPPIAFEIRHDGGFEGFEEGTVIEVVGVFAELPPTEPGDYFIEVMAVN